MVEGYGLTESACGGLLTNNLDPTVDGHAGGPGENIEFKL